MRFSAALKWFTLNTRIPLKNAKMAHLLGQDNYFVNEKMVKKFLIFIK